MTILKMRQLIEGFDPQSSAKPAGGVIQNSDEPAPLTTEEKKAALEAIGRYNEFGNHLRREHNLMEIAHSLSEIVKHAQRFAAEEGKKSTNEDAWFDSKTVNENMGQLNKISENFVKLAKEAHTLQQRMEALYEDGGHVLSRYFEIKDLQEGAPAISKITEKKQ